MALRVFLAHDGFGNAVEISEGLRGPEKAVLPGLTIPLPAAFAGIIRESEAKSHQRFEGLIEGLDGSNKRILP